jgi:putative tryptophan/tyrosine transport system substrate-binding protein
VPKIARPAVLWNPTHPAHADGLKELEAAGRRLGVQVHGYPVNSAGEIDEAFAAMRRARSDGLVVLGSGLHLLHLRQIAAGALKLRVPAICFFRQFVNVDGLMAYGVDERDLARRAATYVDKILKGSKPGDLPVEQATKFELVINLKTAKALGLTIPQSVLGRADEVIE